MPSLGFIRLQRTPCIIRNVRGRQGTEIQQKYITNDCRMNQSMRPINLWYQNVLNVEATLTGVLVEGV